MPKCPLCEDGKMKYTSVDLFGDKPEEVFYANCSFCGATGVVEPSFVDAYNEQLRMWCECSQPSENVDFYDDGIHPDLWKHHYRCKRCGKVTQIG